MRTFHCILLMCFAVLSSVDTARAEAEKKVLVPGPPPLTQDMLDDYCKFLEWRLGSALEKVGGIDRLRQMLINDWRNGNKARQKAFAEDLKWWREDYPKLTAAERERLVARNTDRAEAERREQLKRDMETLQMLKLQMQHDARMRDIRMLSDLQAKHHELMMRIIDNIRPTGRYEYNPATGRYDRYVP
jgi:hypothetical protein